ncbi:MAG: ABC-2 family transporter protein [Candidatus Marinimicrobia bacterium]|nr:ABC-2 family transporter protein [Candidatus Neomarinimicrobiota bacterium]
MEDSVRRYISLWWSLFQNSLTRDMEFKANFLGGLFVDVIFYGIQFFFFSVIYSYVDAIGVFTKEDVMIFLIVTFLTDTLYMFFFAGNLFNLNRWMVRGDLDFFLLKPVHSQFLVSFRYIKSYAVVSLVILSILLVSRVVIYSQAVPLLNWAVFIISLGLGWIIWYGVEFIISTSCFWFKNFSVSGWLSHEILKFSTRPDSIYTGLFRKVLLSAIPMILIVSIPTRILLYGPDIKYLGWQLIVALVFLINSRIIWKKGLLRYESASS